MSQRVVLGQMVGSRSTIVHMMASREGLRFELRLGKLDTGHQIVLYHVAYGSAEALNISFSANSLNGHGRLLTDDTQGILRAKV